MIIVTSMFSKCFPSTLKRKATFSNSSGLKSSAFKTDKCGIGRPKCSKVKLYFQISLVYCGQGLYV